MSCAHAWTASHQSSHWPLPLVSSSRTHASQRARRSTHTSQTVRLQDVYTSSTYPPHRGVVPRTIPYVPSSCHQQTKTSQRASSHSRQAKPAHRCTVHVPSSTVLPDLDTHTHARQDGSTDLTVPQEVELVDAVVHALHVLEDVGPCVGRGTQGRHVARLQQGRPRTSARTERHSTSLSDACSQYDTSLLSAHACECECRAASVCVCVCARVSVLACVHCLASARDGLLRGHSQAAWGCPRTQGTGHHVCP